jgi:WD40 repeat protein
LVGCPSGTGNWRIGAAIPFLLVGQAGVSGQLYMGESGPACIVLLAVMADGRLAGGGRDGTIKVWPKDFTGEPVVLSHGSDVWSLAVLADGRLASGGEGGQIKLWLVDEKKLIAALCLRAGRNLSKAEWARYIGADTPWQPSCRSFGVPSNWRTIDEHKSGAPALDNAPAGIVT